MRRSSWPLIGVIAVLAAAVFAAGSAAAQLWLMPPVPGSLRPPTSAASASVVLQDFDDARPVVLRFDTRPDTVLTTALGGRVTSTECAPGAPVRSGDELLTLDERPLIALSTTVPLWRDIGVGDQGEDVRALQNELQRLGFSVVADGTAGRVTVGSVAELLRRAGERAGAERAGAERTAPTVVPADRIVWIPAPNVTVASCRATLGSVLRGGDDLATLAGGLTRASVAPMPSDLVAGERVVTLDGLTVAVGPDGVVSDPAALALLETTASYARRGEKTATDPTAAAGQADAGTAQSTADAPAAGAVTGRISLAAPVQIGVVPPSALYALAADRACVSSGSVGYPVVVVGSRLGQSYVLFEAARTDRVDLSPQSEPTCR